MALLATSCANEPQPENTVEAAAPFELLCRYKTPYADEHVSYRISGNSITTKGQYDEAWTKACDQPQVTSCKTDINESMISIHRNVYFNDGAGTEYILIDRITGGSEFTTSSSTGEQETRRGVCVKSENRAF